MSISTAYEDHDATGLAALVRRGETTPAELLEEALRRAEALNPQLNALTLLRPDVARAAAGSLPDGPFKGVPFLLKDLGAEAADFPSNSGSRLTEAAPGPGDSALVARLKAAGVNIFGRTTSPEFGVGPATESAVYGGPTRNPWNLDRTSGGSSGGSAAAVAAGIVPAAHASDGAGSIRIPAASSGLYGLKPSRGLIPTGPFAGEGWAGLATSGFLTRSVRDTAGLLDAVAGRDLGAPYAAPTFPAPLSTALDARPARLRVRILTTTLTGAAIHPACAEAVTRTAKLLESMGHAVEPAALPDMDTDEVMVAVARILAVATATAVTKAAEARGIRPEDAPVEPVARDALDVARGLSAMQAGLDTAMVHAYGRSLARWMEGADAMVTATLAEPPAVVGRFAHANKGFMDYRLGEQGVYAYSPFTAAFNASGQPAASLPLHWTEDGLPIGVHIAMPFGEDPRLLALSAQLEDAAPWFDRRPPVRMA